MSSLDAGFSSSVVFAQSVSQAKAHRRRYRANEVSSIAAGLLALLLIPSSPRHTGGRFRGKGWLSEREADIFLARLVLDDPLQGHPSTMKITLSDM